MQTAMPLNRHSMGLTNTGTVKTRDFPYYDFKELQSHSMSWAGHSIKFMGLKSEPGRNESTAAQSCIQRNLQLRIEEQGRCLQMMFEKQCKSGVDLFKASSPPLDNPRAQLTDSAQNSPTKNEPGPSQEDHHETGNDPVNTITVSEDGCQKLTGKQKVPGTKPSDDVEANVVGATNSPPSKRAKVNE
ncbi:unnamed protein product [Ilex paraguariensis]|uniref:MYB-CC type transcription factor LHEQLE-containing domain-containing protein n=1 Tax=Ilex paraguariensis TaxID=185542 RepID=A0ABC8SYS1_9AQUA